MALMWSLAQSLLLRLLLPAAAFPLLLRLQQECDDLDFGCFSSDLANMLSRYFSFGIAISFSFCSLVLLMEPNASSLAKLGDWTYPASEIAWLGVPEGKAWTAVATRLLPTIAAAFAVYMYYSGEREFNFWRTVYYFPLILLFSALNALVEELIARWGLIALLQGRLSSDTIAAVSGVIFGLPHYWGYPNGIMGVLMTTFLGWLLARCTMETGGLGLAWALHTAMDVVVFTVLFGREEDDEERLHKAYMDGEGNEWQDGMEYEREKQRWRLQVNRMAREAARQKAQPQSEGGQQTYGSRGQASSSQQARRPGPGTTTSNRRTAGREEYSSNR